MRIPGGMLAEKQEGMLEHPHGRQANDLEAVMLRPNSSQASAFQNGRTITSTTIRTTAMPGSSFISRSALPLTGRAPAASFLP